MYEAEFVRIGVVLEKLSKEKRIDGRECRDLESDSDWLDDYESEGDSEGWCTTDEVD
jgi:hypothetical protein